MSAILDMITGGGLLPHVYCKKVTLENHSDDIDAVSVTLDFELFQLASALSESNWLNNFNVLGANIYDSMMIEVIPFRHPNNIKKLLASNTPKAWPKLTTMFSEMLESGVAHEDFNIPISSVGNVYVLKQQAGDGYLPRSSIKTVDQEDGPFSGNLNTIFPISSEFGTSMESWTPPIRMKSSSIIQSLSGKFLEAPTEAGGYYSQDLNVLPPREEIKNGQVYYVIPFRQTFQHNIKTHPNLGFLFYSMLHIPDFLAATGEFSNEEIHTVVGENLEQLVIEGSVNTEIVFKDGKPTQTREAFFLPNGREWEGSVHLHAEGYNPDPDGYAGDGGYGENKGWMVGEKHIGMSDQPKISLQEVPNRRMQDFRRTLAEQPYDGFMGLGVDAPIFSLNAKVQNAVHLFLSPFQKESRKYLSKFGGKKSDGAQYNSVGVSYYDNDAEFSKLYLSRDRSNNARGVFFINMEEFMRNNSKIFPIMFDKAPLKWTYLGPTADPPWKWQPDLEGIEIVEQEKRRILASSKIIEIKLYRDRVKKNMVGIKRENYANDTTYEEPSFLVGTVGAHEVGSTGLKKLSLGGTVDPLLQKFFMFSDHDVGEKSAGLYQYRMDVILQDGTYQYLNDLLRQVVQARMLADEYYNLATGFYSDMTQIAQGKDKGWQGGEKYKNKPYFQNGAFTQQFKLDADANSRLISLASNPNNNVITNILRKTKYIFGLNSLGDLKSLSSYLDPSSGSPQGISFIIKLLHSVIKKLEDLLEVNKIKKTGSELANTSVASGYNLANFIDVDISPSDSIVHDSHTFNSLFEGLSNENIFSDYLSVNSAYGHNYYAGHGLRRLYISGYTKRCQLETAKIISQLPLSTNWDTQHSQPTPTGQNGTYTDGNVRWSDAGYSYLSPSIVELSDSLYDPSREEKRSYSFHYNTFKPNAEDYLTSTYAFASTDLHAESYKDYSNYDRLLMSIMSHGLNKKDTPHADLTDAFSVDNIWYNDSGGGYINPMKIETREAYKNVFDRYGLVVHQMDNYEKFYGENFSKAGGVLGPDIKNDREEYHDSTNVPGMWLNKDFSDGRMMSQEYLRKLLFDPSQLLIEKPRFAAVVPPILINTSDASWTKLPNVEKAYYIYRNGTFSDIQSRFKKLFDTVIPHAHAGIFYSSEIQYHAFMFFHMGLQVKVEVFDPKGEITVAKNDEEYWTLLTRDHINNVAKMQQLLCRMVYNNEKIAQSVRLPMLDKYFLISRPDGGAVTEFVTQQATTAVTTTQAQATTGGTTAAAGQTPTTMGNQGNGNY